MAFPRLKRLWSVARLDRQYRQLGWRRGTYFWNFYQGRLSDHLPGRPTKLKTFLCKHSLTGQMSPLTLRVDPGGSDFIALQGVWVHQDYYHPSFAGAQTILDIGGNIGLSAVWFYQWLQPKAYACVEPDPRNLMILRKNLETNHIPAHIFACAATAEPGEFRFGLAHHFGCSYLEGIEIPDGHHGAPEFVSVPGRPIASLLDELGWPRVDLLKMDIEGGERDLLRAGASWIDRVGQIVLEIHGNTSPEEIRSFLPPGWKLERLGATDEPTYRACRAP
jgi:FkbM family methyltransferase